MKNIRHALARGEACQNSHNLSPPAPAYEMPKNPSAHLPSDYFEAMKNHKNIILIAAIFILFCLFICNIFLKSQWHPTIQKNGFSMLKENKEPMDGKPVVPHKIKPNDGAALERGILDRPVESLAIAREMLAYARDSRSGSERSMLMKNIMVEAINKISLEDSLLLLLELPTGTVFDTASAALGARFAELDPVSGIAWLQSLPKTAEGISATMAFYNKYAALNPVEALKSLEDLNKVRQGEALRSVVQILAKNHTDLLVEALKNSEFSDMCNKNHINARNFLLNEIMASKNYQ